ncbi:hypothetical protein [Paenibacillus sp. SAF-068]|uniref:hypothetical protein n=1 Tax=Paenibacillus sp. SAF-068 TaxID=3436864 RepID=UPI003F7E8C46
MAENILLGALRRYEFYSYCTTFIQTLYDTVTQDLYGDIHWEWTFSNNNTYATPRAWNNSNYTSANNGTITAKNKKDPSMFFTICTNLAQTNAWSDRVYYKNYVLRAGLRNNGDIITPDLYTQVGHLSEIPLHTGDSYIASSNTTSSHTNVYFKWTLFTSEQYIFLYGEPQNNIGVAYPIRLYLGRLKPFEEEDPLISNDFVGVFSHFPMGLNDSADELKYRAGGGYVRSSRNGTPNALYNLATSSQVPSPGVGGRFFISPFYVWHDTEGARGEFYGIRTAVLKDASKYPDGSILDLGDERYYVFHTNSQAHPSTFQGWFTTGGKYIEGQPYFFDSALLLGGGQRVLLFEIEKEV